MDTCNLDELTKEELKDLVIELRETLNKTRIFKPRPKKIKLEKKKEKPSKDLNFSEYDKCYIALKIIYLGWNYDGFARTANSTNTVEKHLIDSLIKCRFIESENTCEYAACGRTDKGVSATCQVITLSMRSKNKTKINVNNFMATSEDGDYYLSSLNNSLPDDIFVVAWFPIDCTISARFSCLTRTYHYYFPIQNLNIQIMNETCKYFIGEFDFRNFCKVDTCNVVAHYNRTIVECYIEACENHSQKYARLVVKGYAFLWHQIRSMATVIFTTGLGLEKPNIVKHMLNVNECLEKPQYCIASEIPLILVNCEYEGFDWIYNQKISNNILKKLNYYWIENYSKLHVVEEAQRAISKSYSSNDEFPNAKYLVYELNWCKSYKPLQKRDVCDGRTTKIELLQQNLKLKQSFKNTEDIK